MPCNSRNPGPLNHSRFLTTANATLRLYISTEKPSQNSKLLVNYIITLYAPLWFGIKSKSGIGNGPKHLFMMLKLIRENIPKNVQRLLIDVVERNAYFAHSENVLLSMLVDEDSSTRSKAVLKNNFTTNQIEGRLRKLFELVKIIKMLRNTFASEVRNISIEFRLISR